MKRTLLLLLVAGLVCSPVFSAQIADLFRYPVGDEIGSGWLVNRGGLQWLDHWNYGGSCGWVYHPGVDFNKDNTSGDGDRYEPVYAIANGEVLESYYESGSTWGNIILIKHTLSSGEAVFSQYGHLETRMVSAASTVTKGQQIGTVGKGVGLNAHLHFELRKSNMSGYTAKHFPCGQAQSFVEKLYFDPETFIKIGHFANINSNITKKFVERYEIKMGVPFEDVGGSIYVHNWPANDANNDVLIQNFKNSDLDSEHYGTDGETALIYNENQDNCWLVKEGFWGLYKPGQFVLTDGSTTLKDFFGPRDLGAPREDERNDSLNINIRTQEFEKGWFSWDSRSDVFRLQWKAGHAPSGFVSPQSEMDKCSV